VTTCQKQKLELCREMQAWFVHLCFPLPSKVMIHCRCIDLHKEIPLNFAHQDCPKGLTMLLQEEMKAWVFKEFEFSPYSGTERALFNSPKSNWHVFVNCNC
jgi:hypothetical protein